MEKNPKLLAAQSFFYPKGSWDGYAKLFSPSISSKIGDKLIAAASKALYPSIKDTNNIPLRKALEKQDLRGIEEACKELVSILSKPQKKFTDGYGITCLPTKAAKEGENLIKNYLPSLKEIEGPQLQ